MFWALKMSSGKRYSQLVRKPFHLSMACLDLDNTQSDISSVYVQVNKEKYIICNLSKTKLMQQLLDLNFQAGDEVIFFAKGKAVVHLSGYIIPEDDMPGMLSDESEDDVEDDVEEEAEEETEEDSKEGAKERLKAMATKSLKRGLEDKTSKNKKQKLESSGTEEASDEDEDDDDETSVVDETSEDDSDYEENTGETVSDSVESDDTEPLIIERKDTLKPTPEKKSKQKETPGKPGKKEATPGRKQESFNGTPSQQSAKKKKQKDGTPQSKDDTQSPKPEGLQKKTLSGGVVIEDLRLGTGPIAKSGRMVSVYYVGRLKSNNRMFDSSQQGPGLKFRLGHNEVIRGWDLGVTGMKVGGKRKIICPPAMAYGTKGSPPLIPPHSSLIFEVELKNVH